MPPGWQTDLAVLRHSGSTIEDRGDHLIVRSPHSPDFHWGNCVFVTDAATVNDAEGWVRTFHAAMPTATWVAIGLVRMPDDQEPWLTQGLDVELDDVLTTRTLPRQTPLPEGYTVRRLADGDWAQSVARTVAENKQSGDYDPSLARTVRVGPGERAAGAVRAGRRRVLRRVHGRDPGREPWHRLL